MLTLFLEFLLVFLAATVSTGVVRRLLLKKAILDTPNGRSSHSTPTPRGGGLATSLVILGVWAGYAGYLGQYSYALPIAGGLLLFAVSWLDDLRSLPPLPRFAAHIGAVALALPWILDTGTPVTGFLPLWFEYLCLGLLWVAFINFFNFMDGIDGISGVQAATMGTGHFLHACLLAGGIASFEPGLIIAAAAMGFLLWNWHPAKIFLGDVGSVPLGYLLGGLMLALAADGLWLPALIIPLYYLMDAGLTLIKRALRGERVWQAHREHHYQKAVQNGRSHAQVSAAIATTNIGLLALSVWSYQAPATAFAAAVLLTSGLMWWMVSRPRSQRSTI